MVEITKATYGKNSTYQLLGISTTLQDMSKYARNKDIFHLTNTIHFLHFLVHVFI